MATSNKPVHRVALFKIAKEDDIATFVEKTREMSNKAVKDGKNYITDIKAGPVLNKDQRAQGYTFVISATFDSMEDHKYFDEECEAHKELKDALGSHLDGRLVLWYEDSSTSTFMKLTPHD